MSNVLDNGTVLPSGLLTEDWKTSIAAFAKTHQNFALRVGVVVTSYPISDENNKLKLCNEYDVIAIEQQEDRGTTAITYRNCLSAEGLGSVADFFERTLRKRMTNENKNNVPDLAGQNGAVVLLLCLDAMSEKAIIIGALTHPDRNTTLTDEGPRLEGEYNGVNIKVETDGSTSLTFKGATDNDGKAIDSTQGNTVIQVEKDGSFQVSHDSITQRFDRGGVASIAAKDNIESTTQKDFDVTAQGNVNFQATKDYNAQANNILLAAQGSATINCESGTINAQSGLTVKGSSISAEASGIAKIKAASITLDGIVALGGAGGTPVLILTTQFLGIGNLGLPVISTAIAGYATKVTAQ